MAKSRTRTVRPLTLDRADRLFLASGLARGMPIPAIAGFLNRSEQEVRGYLTSSKSEDPAKDTQRRSTAKRSPFSSGLDVTIDTRRISPPLILCARSTLDTHVTHPMCDRPMCDGTSGTPSHRGYRHPFPHRWLAPYRLTRFAPIIIHDGTWSSYVVLPFGGAR